MEGSSNPTDDFWNSINKYPIVNDSVTIKRVHIKADKFTFNKHYNKSIKKYIFEDCEFSEYFIMTLDSSVESDFVFHNCNFKSFVCESYSAKGKEYSGVIRLSGKNHQGDIKFNGSFKNRIYIDNIGLDKECSIDFTGSIDKDSSCFYSDIVILRTSAQILLYQCDVGSLLVEESKFIKEISVKDVVIKNKLSIIGIDKCDLLEINNLDCHEGSKVLFENLALDKLFFIKISQDVKYMQFNNVWLEEKFLCEKVEFKNTYFNDFNIENAKKFISKTSFIDAHLNDVNWGDVSSISANEATFRQLKFVNDSQGSHLIANQFYAMEMRKYQEEFKGNCQARLVLWLNKVISNFGQSYIQPFWLIVITLEIQHLLNCSYKAGGLFSENYLFSNYYVKIIGEFFNKLASNLVPVSKFLEEGREAVSLLFFMILSVLIWHLVVALKRHAKR